MHSRSGISGWEVGVLHLRQRRTACEVTSCLTQEIARHGFFLKNSRGPCRRCQARQSRAQCGQAMNTWIILRDYRKLGGKEWNGIQLGKCKVMHLGASNQKHVDLSRIQQPLASGQKRHDMNTPQKATLRILSSNLPFENREWEKTVAETWSHTMREGK